MKIGIVTDEISTDIKEAFSLGLKWGIKDYEVRCIGANRVPYITPDDIAIIQGYRGHSEIRITALSPGVFKVPLSDKATIEKELEKTLPLTFDLAKKLDCTNIIIFGFKKEADEAYDNLSQAIKSLSEAAQQAQRHGMTLLVENEPGFWCDTGKNTTEIIELVNSPNLKANWDPANSACAGETPYPTGYGYIKKFIANIHIKDTQGDPSKECVLIGDGIVDWQGQLSALVNDGLLSHVTIETHSLPLIDKSQKNLERVRKILGMN
jgi:sugar phosphate isomerase/epimerase